MALENKMGIKDSLELAKIEERISKKKAVELFEEGLLDSHQVEIFKGLANIHKYLFSDIYDFAGKHRKENIVKGNFRFVPTMYLDEASYYYEGYNIYKTDNL